MKLEQRYDWIRWWLRSKLWAFPKTWTVFLAWCIQKGNVVEPDVHAKGETLLRNHHLLKISWWCFGVFLLFLVGWLVFLNKTFFFYCGKGNYNTQHTWKKQCQNAVTALTWLDLYCNPKSTNPLCLGSLSLMSAI